VPVDPVTVLDQLRRQGMGHASTAHRDAGVLLVDLCQAAPCIDSAGHYLRIVPELANRRRVQQAALRRQSAATGSLAGLLALVKGEERAVLAAQERVAVSF
jgi:replicative DNA helicase